MLQQRSRNVAVIVATVLVAVTTIVLATFTTISHLSERRREMGRLRLDLAAEADQLADSLALPVWNIDRAQIDKIVDGLAGIPHVQAVIVSAAGKTHARMRDEHWRFVEGTGRDLSGLLVEERPVTFSGEPIGTLRVFASRRFVDASLRRSLLSMIGAIVLVDVLLSFSVYVILWRSVLRPLGAVEKYAHTVSADGAENVEMPLDAGAANELISLRSSIQSMVRLLAQRYAAQRRESLARIESEERFRTIFDSVNDAIMIEDLETGTILDVNRATFAMFGYAPGEASTVDIANLTLGAGGFTTEAAQLRLREVAAGEPQLFEWQARRKDGSLFWADVSLYSAILSGKKMAVAVVRDISQRREMEDAQAGLRNELVQSATEWRQTFDTVLTPILITDGECRIRRVNRAALDLTGLAEHELLGRRVQEIDAGEPWATAAQLGESIQPHDSIATAETKDGLGRTWDLSIAHFETTRDGADRFIIVFWEITRIVDLQESLRRSETLSAMGTLVAGVAHEVRNPLFGISATLDAYHAELSRAGYEDFHTTLLREVNRLRDLMQELLEYGRPTVLALEHGSVPEVIEAAIAGRQSAARAAGVGIEHLVTEGEEDTLLIDGSRLQQVFENLIDNAVQHSRAGGRVRISSRAVEQGGRRWTEFLVEDDGSGFPAQYLDRVFEPFFTDREGGTGLGLSIVQRIVEEHSGKVSAGNRPGGGAVVAILMPVADAQASAKAPPGAAAVR